ncbi:NADPH-dependent FMN reductase [Candidatus Mycoplasma haematominutum]|uniref:NADPH-dependent FMN reductase n=1 Tax=Candidatus Mycoplasma haematominutum 'Birmingham 1' TaxID=1116213 RepID=G8C2V1_9MOLU|nr:NADPH-dependent FMN reductase [Candidatus Mycoplasma haematominutum]CCE66649.1 NADPH-dependent FMN reductase [Candidatus Mycoplasma haematominutum 'Birmingham 1']
MNKRDTIIICGSNSKQSKSKELTEGLSRELSIWALYFNPTEIIPILSNEVIAEKELPASISFLVEKIKTHHNLIFVFPQYNYNFSAFFKNVLDWCSLSSRNIFYAKRVILIGVSSTEIGTREFEQVCVNTFNSLGAEEIKFVNTTKESSMQKLVEKLRVYV